MTLYFIILILFLFWYIYSYDKKWKETHEEF